MDTAYGTNANQLALSLLGVRISPAGSGDWGAALADARKAVAWRPHIGDAVDTAGFDEG